jgi:flavin reductase (DIM6/NTAB) family NADH-FMN oxidoreductase RutF
MSQPVPRPSTVREIQSDRAWRLFNTGATVIVGAAHAGEVNAMAVAWNMALDYAPGNAKVAVVIDKACHTRGLIERSNRFSLTVVTVGSMRACMLTGTRSAKDFAAHDKLGALQVPYFLGEAHEHGALPLKESVTDALPLENRACDALPLVSGGCGWVECERLIELHNERTYDLFIGRITRAWADVRAFGEKAFLPLDQIPHDLRTIHHLGSGEFVVPGEQMLYKK